MPLLLWLFLFYKLISEAFPGPRQAISMFFGSMFLSNRGLGGVLADDMGLGKTVQSITFVLHRHKEDPGVHLVIAPRSVVDNWVDECKKFCPEIPVHTHLGLDRVKSIERLPKKGLLLTSYNILQRDIKLLSSIEYSTVILDEAHVIRNPEAKTTRAALKLAARRRMCLSGTPVQNCAEDLWPIFHFLMPGFLGRRKTLKETLQDDPEAINRLRDRVAPFVLRRIKSEVATELPPKTEILLHAEMSDDQERFYKGLLEKERVGVMDLLGSKGLERSRVSILAAITRLRQAACAPALVGAPEIGSAKVELFMDLVKDDHVVGSGEIETHATGLERNQEQWVVALLERFHLCRAVARAAVEVLVGEVFLFEFLLDYR